MNLENKKQIAIIILALGLGLVAALLTSTHIQTSIQQETKRLTTEYQKMYVQPLKGEIDSLRGELKRLETMQKQMSVAGPALAKGAEKRPETPEVPKSFLALRTPPGKRAYTVRIDSLSAVGGLINPGDYVDIIAHMDMPDPATNVKEKISSIIFQNILILAVGTNLQAPGGYEQQQQARSLNITVALTPEEAGLMSFVERNAQMQFILRAPAETENEILQVATWSTLADYVYEKQGTELLIPRGKAFIEPVSGSQKEEVKPYIQIFRGGRQE